MPGLSISLAVCQQHTVQKCVAVRPLFQVALILDLKFGFEVPGPSFSPRKLSPPTGDISLWPLLKSTCTQEHSRTHNADNLENQDAELQRAPAGHSWALLRAGDSSFVPLSFPQISKQFREDHDGFTPKELKSPRCDFFRTKDVRMTLLRALPQALCSDAKSPNKAKQKLKRMKTR